MRAWVPEERVILYCILCKLCAIMPDCRVHRFGPDILQNLCASEANTGRGPPSFGEASKGSSKWLSRSKPHMLRGRTNLL